MPAPDTKPARTPRELTVSAAVAKLRKLIEAESAEYDAIDEDAAGRKNKVANKYGARRDATVASVHPSARDAVLKEAGIEVAPGDDVPPMTADEIDSAIESTESALPKGAMPLSEERARIGRGR